MNNLGAEAFVYDDLNEPLASDKNSKGVGEKEGR